MNDKINQVKNIFKDKKVVVAFSAGSDSTLLAYLSQKTAKKTLLVTVDNGLFKEDFIENAKKTAEKFNLEHKVIKLNFYDNCEIIKNNTHRCYNCRRLMYEEIIKNSKGYDYICDGNNITDLLNDRPGILATYEYNMKTPLIEARLTSKQIHDYLDKNNIHYSKNTTCLATRIKTDTPITHEKIDKINEYERYIQDNTDCKVVKVRLNDTTIHIEVDNIHKIIEDDKYKQIYDYLNDNKDKKVLLNLKEVKDKEEISLNYNDGSFTYKLPYNIDIDMTIKNIDYIQYDKNIINRSKSTIEKSGIIKGHGFESYQEALDEFMDILSKIRRIR